jgi:hypothetical protein
LATGNGLVQAAAMTPHVWNAVALLSDTPFVEGEDSRFAFNAEDDVPF